MQIFSSMTIWQKQHPVCILGQNPNSLEGMNALSVSLPSNESVLLYIQSFVPLEIKESNKC